MRISARSRVSAGENVKQGQKLAIMGHTGTGIDRERAHVHVELNLLLNDHFEEWHDMYFRGEPNRHGIYNGLNLAGIDLPRLILAARSNPALTMAAFFGREEVFYKVLLPNTPGFQLPERYPWMIERTPNDKPASWEVSFTRSGLPIAIAPSSRAVSAAEISYVKQVPGNLGNPTRHLAGRASSPRLSESGKIYMRLLTFPD